MKIQTIPVVAGNYNLDDYEKTVESFDWTQAEEQFSWFKTGKMNIAYETIDCHAESEKANKVALLFKDGDRREKFTFKEMSEKSNKAANVLKKLGVKKGDRVFIFMPRSPDLYICLLGAIKLGAIVGPLFESFMDVAVFDRLNDSQAKVLITTSELVGRVNGDQLPHLEKIALIGENVEENSKIINFKDHLAKASNQLEIEWVNREDGMLLHYTSGSTGKPKGILHTHNAMIQLYQTAKWVLDLNEDDIYWCTADPGWITGTVYGIFGPWLHGTTNVVHCGRFSCQDWYKTIEEYKVTVWYSAPTAFRMLLGVGEELTQRFDLSSLRHILSVGEPLNPEVVNWAVKVFKVRIHDTWWMTETGAMMICNYPCLMIKPGSMGKPVPGIEAAIIDNHGNVHPPNKVGNLAFRMGWPSMMHSIWKDPKKYKEYFTHNGWYISGDSAYMDEDGYFWFQGRIDDVINTSGERVGPFEVESKLIEHPAIAEAGVIGIPDPVQGMFIKAFITLREGYKESDELKEEIRMFVKKELSANAVPRQIQFRDKLPKTRSGKIMRRVLKAWELDLPAGDLSTMDD
jgi:acetyl-CoA synthetase